MIELTDARFLNPVWHALHGPHRHLAIGSVGACRYPADVSPFAAMETGSASAQRQLHALLGVGESVWMAGTPDHPGLRVEQELDCLQMVLPRDAPVATPVPGPVPTPGSDIEPLSAENAAEMVALTDVAFPGFFRAATHRMGSYAGIRLDGRLIAMAGERLRLEGYPELSGICTHPEHRGKGLAAGLIGYLVAAHRRQGLCSWLHVGAPNTRAIELYGRLGFVRVRNLMLRRISRTD
jgi:ribosomal protein S18 acetylase RimI-like enzyme